MTFSDDSSIAKIPNWVEEEFLTELRAGKTPKVNDYANRVPEHREKVTAYLQLLLFMEQVRHSSVKADDKHLPAAPEEIGKYKVLSTIGRGGMGTVYQAEDPDTGRNVAIKVLHPERNDLSQRFRREAMTIQQLDHPNIVKVLGFQEDEGVAYLIMQFIHGTGLDAVLKQRRSYTSDYSNPQPGTLNPVTEDSVNRGQTLSSAAATLVAKDFLRIAAIGADVASALAHTHFRGVIHRDIKPANLILATDGSVWITDFGLAKALATEEELTNVGDLIGTPRYMSPEQMRGVVDDRTDIYSLGITLWELCTGLRAWSTSVKKEPSGWTLPTAVSVNPDVPNQLSDTLAACCSLEQDQRPSATELHQQLQSFLRTRELDNRLKHTKQRTQLFLAALCILSALVAGFVFARSTNKADQTLRDSPDRVAAASMVNLGAVEEETIEPERAEMHAANLSPGQYAMAENFRTVAYVNDVFEVVPDSGELTLSGPDAELFEIVGEERILQFRTPPNYEAPTDNGENAVYEVSLLSSVDGQVDSVDIVVRILDIEEGITFVGTLPGDTVVIDGREGQTRRTDAVRPQKTGIRKPQRSRLHR